MSNFWKWLAKLVLKFLQPSLILISPNVSSGSIRDNDTQDKTIHPTTKLNQSPGSKTNTDSDKQIFCDQNIPTLKAVSLLPVNQSIVCQNCMIQASPMARPNVPPSVRRTASYHQQRGRKEIKKQSLQRSGTILIQGPPAAHAINVKVQQFENNLHSKFLAFSVR